MIHRMFRNKDTGQWAAAVLSQESFVKPERRTTIVREEFRGQVYEHDRIDEVDVPDDGREYADRVAADLGLAPGALEVVDVVDGEPDPRVGVLLAPEPPKVDEQPQEPEPTFATALRGAEV